MPYLEPLQKSTPQPKVKRVKGSRTRTRRLSTSGRDRFRRGPR